MFKKVLLLLITILMAISLFGCSDKGNSETNTGCNPREEECSNEDLVTKNLIWESISFDKSLDYLNGKESVMLFFSFDDCPWCKEAKPYLEEISKEFPNIKTLYVDVKRTEREKGQDTYDKVYTIFEPYLKEELGQDNEKMYVPYFVFLKDGEIVFTKTSTIDDEQHMNASQISQFKEMLREAYKKIS